MWLCDYLSMQVCRAGAVAMIHWGRICHATCNSGCWGDGFTGNINVTPGVQEKFTLMTEMEMTFWQNFHHWLHCKLSFWQLPVQPVMEILSKWLFRFGVFLVAMIYGGYICHVTCNNVWQDDGFPRNTSVAPVISCSAHYMLLSHILL